MDDQSPVQGAGFMKKFGEYSDPPPTFWIKKLEQHLVDI